MSKAIAEQSHGLSIFWLKKHGFLHKDFSHKSGGITWTCGSNKNSISFSVGRDNWGTPEESTYVTLIYTNTNRHTDEKTDMNYRVRMMATNCRYGGKRYWFTCPLSKNGVYCGRRVGVLFSIGKWFGCRHCGDIAYQSQMYGGSYKGFVSAPDIDRAEAKVTKKYYRGKPTRQYRKVLYLNQKFDYQFMAMAAKIDKRFIPFANRRK